MNVICYCLYTSDLEARSLQTQIKSFTAKLASYMKFGQ